MENMRICYEISTSDEAIHKTLATVKLLRNNPLPATLINSQNISTLLTRAHLLVLLHLFSLAFILMTHVRFITDSGKMYMQSLVSVCV